MIPNGCVGLVIARSSLFVKHKLALANALGVIDSDYRGPIKLALINYNDTEYRLDKPLKAAQLVILDYNQVYGLKRGTIAKDTERGEGGFGSTD